MGDLSTKIFIVDDNQFNIKMLFAVLKRVGFTNVLTFTDPVVALEQYYIERPELILLDMQMPIMSGLDFMEKIKLDIDAAIVAVIILTANSGKKTRMEALSLGAQDYIEKPIDVIETTKRIQNVVHIIGKKRELVHENKSLDHQLRRINESLQSVTGILQTVFNESTEILFIVDENNQIIEYNNTAEVYFDLKTQKMNTLFSVFNVPAELLNQSRLAVTNNFSKKEMVLENNNKQIIINNKPHKIYLLKDITQQIRDEKKLHQMAETNYISKLPNRFQLKSLFGRLVSENTQQEQVGILFIAFYQQNKILHHYGSEWLQRTQKVISNLLNNIALSSSCALIHWNSNEFVLLCLKPQLMLLIKNITACFEHLINVHDLQLHISPNLGYYMLPAEGFDCDLQTFVDYASIAAHTAYSKQLTVTEYDKKIKQAIADEDEIETELISAIRNQHFKIAYQPLVDLKNNLTICVEALIRWHHPTLGNVSPETFIPIAERCGLINAIGKQVISQVFTDYFHLKKQYKALKFVAMNIAPQQLNDELVSYLVTMLNQHQLQASYFKLEITEMSLLEDFKRVNNILLELKSIGFSIALDDFGTGYSSLSYIHKMPIDVIKIDRSFVAKIQSSHKGLILVKSIVSMSLALELQIVAEGIEDKETSDLLASLGVHVGQGYYFSKPEFIH